MGDIIVENEVCGITIDIEFEPELEVDSGLSCYARFFDDSCRPGTWMNDAVRNHYFLLQTQNYANDLLRSRYKPEFGMRGYVYLNEVHEMLGMTKTETGEVVGWIYDEENPIGDNFIDFGIYNERNRDFINKYEPTILLDFNVDGCIVNRMFV